MANITLTRAAEDALDARTDRDCKAEREAYDAALVAALALVPADREDLRDALFGLEDRAAAWHLRTAEAGYQLGLEVGNRATVDALRVGVSALRSGRAHAQ